MTADDLTRLRGEHRPVHRKYVGLIDDVRLYLTCRCPIGRNHTEVDRVERAERRALIAEESGNAEAGEHEQLRSELAALRAAVEGLADEWENYDAEGYAAGDGPDWWTRTAQLRGLLTEGADDGQ